ncbi:hypothetical protein EON64_20550 [archaeon]|nr:MAG: hypothetical protein EON64_20550 [archaeon]
MYRSPTPYTFASNADGSGVINFMEFVCTLWNLLTLPEKHCAVIAYMIKDRSTKGDISCTSPPHLSPPPTHV